jgi:YVTN family beta-propeller protein
VGSGPHGIGYDTTHNRLYVPNSLAGTVSVIDAATNTEIDTDGIPGNGTTRITVGGGPKSAAHNPVEDEIYVTNSGSGTVSIIDGVTYAVSTVAVGTTPHQSAVDTVANEIYVANEISGNVSVINGSTHVVTNTIDVTGTPIGVAVYPAINRAYAANSSGSVISVIDTSSNLELSTITVGNRPVNIAVNQTTGRLYVSNENGASVSVVSTSTNTVTNTIPVGGPVGRGAIDTAANRVYVATNTANSVKVIDTSTDSVVGAIPITWAQSVAINTATGRLYVNSYSGNTVTVLSLPSHATAAPVGPSLVSFQGRLTDGAGNPVTNGNYSLTFRIYDSPTGGALQWQETQSVAVSGSVFSILLGASTPLAGGVFAADPRYLEVQVASDPPLAPRQRFTTVPYAVNAQSLDGLGQTQFLRSDTSNGFTGTTLTVGTGGNVDRLKVLGQGVMENNISETRWTLRNTSADSNEWLIFATGTGSSKGTRKFVIQDNTAGANADRLSIDSAGNVGIGTNTPGSRLHVPSGYLQIPTVTGAAPPAADCDAAAEAGRMVARTDGATNLYICTGATGWVGK